MPTSDRYLLKSSCVTLCGNRPVFVTRAGLSHRKAPGRCSNCYTRRKFDRTGPVEMSDLTNVRFDISRNSAPDDARDLRKN